MLIHQPQVRVGSSLTHLALRILHTVFEQLDIFSFFLFLRLVAVTIIHTAPG